MFSSNVHLSLPSLSFFRYPPSDDPQTLAPPPAGATLSSPLFTIPPTLYKSALSPKVPFTFAIVYALTVTILNRYNASRGRAPWPASKTRPFFACVIAHNIFLACYSAWTFWGMHTALLASFVNPSSTNGLAGTVDSLCKLHGPAGFGDAVVYNPSISAWTVQNPTIRLNAIGEPDAWDVGRIWNEGLAFYGWLFYLSKFYEVLDTLIILMKGKKSSVLQTYHHAGAMICMWAGIRHMSPPIWLFVYLNSGIHTLMYTYYTLTAFSVPVPRFLKRSLTTMQIIQFVTGASYAALHLFVSYTLPVLSRVTTSSVAPAVVSATGSSSQLKKYLFRAAGGEGLAENVGTDPPNGLKHEVVERLIWTENRVPCLDTSGQAFAIWLNVLYLTPLTWLFLRFFAKSYWGRAAGDKNDERKMGLGKGTDEVKRLEMAGSDALAGVDRMINVKTHERGDGLRAVMKDVDEADRETHERGDGLRAVTKDVDEADRETHERGDGLRAVIKDVDEADRETHERGNGLRAVLKDVDEANREVR